MAQRSLDYSLNKDASLTKKLDRIILHLDMDCFYCQVEQVRLGIPSSEAVAVQQWNVLIAVNYPARAASVTRHSSFLEACEKCPDLLLVHVPTFSTRTPAAGIQVYGAVRGQAMQPPDRTCHKASLQPYREASLRVFSQIRKVLSEYHAAFVLEKASVDEVFVDVSDIVDAIMNKEYGFEIQRGRLVTERPFGPLDWHSCGNSPVILDPSEDSEIATVDDLRIFIGATIASRIREHICKELKYTLSAGIAHNKTLAKLASALNKPNQQTFVLRRHVDRWMRQVPFNRIRSLGGKLGKLLMKIFDHKQMDLSSSDAEGEDDEILEHSDDEPDSQGMATNPNSSDRKEIMASDLWSLTMEDLQKKLGDVESARWVYQVIRGEDHSPVAPRIMTKSFMAAKDMISPLKTWSQLCEWILLLVTELAGRLDEDLQIHYKKPYEKSKSKAIDFSFEPHQLSSKIVALTDQVINALMAENKLFSIFPCGRLALVVSRFKPVVAGSRQTTLSMDTFVTRDKRLSSEHLEPARKEAKKPKRDITSFFPVKDSSIKDDSFKCDKCSQRIVPSDVDAIQEHQDYHLALQIQQELDQQPS